MNKYMRFLNCRRECPFDLATRLVYSYLGYRDRIEQSALITEIRESLPIGHAVARRALADLLNKYGLVISPDDKHFSAVQPVGEQMDWFVSSKKEKPEKHWTQNLMSFRFELPTKENPLSAVSQCLFWLLWDFTRQDKLVKKSGLATMLNVKMLTVSNNLKILETYNLIEVLPSENTELNVYLQTYPNLPDFTEKWWIKAKDKKSDPYSPYMDQFVGAGMPRSHRQKILSVLKKMEEYFPTDESELKWSLDGERLSKGHSPIYYPWTYLKQAITQCEGKPIDDWCKFIVDYLNPLLKARADAVRASRNRLTNALAERERHG